MQLKTFKLSSKLFQHCWHTVLSCSTWSFVFRHSIVYETYQGVTLKIHNFVPAVTNQHFLDGRLYNHLNTSFSLLGLLSGPQACLHFLGIQSDEALLCVIFFMFCPGGDSRQGICICVLLSRHIQDLKIKLCQLSHPTFLKCSEIGCLQITQWIMVRD